MSGPDAPDGTPAAAGPPADAVEPGHRARALAASLLGELTGQRRSSLSFSPQEPSGLASVPRTSGSTAESPADPASPEPRAADAPGETPPGTAAPSPSAPDQQHAARQAAGAAATSDAPEPGASATSGPPPRERSPEPAADRPGEAPTAAAAAPVAPREDGAAQVQQARAPRAQQGSQGSQSQDVRPAPFAYLAVAQHHTGPARATANGALDQAGQRISSRVDRAMVRRAALVTTEAASLLDACDLLDERAGAVDATWTGERHSPTEVREFEGAWSAFYDAQGALAQHVTG